MVYEDSLPPTILALKSNNKFGISFVKIFSLKQILPATIEKIKFYFLKKTGSCSFRL